MIFFFVNGFAGANWFVRIPAVQGALGLSNAALGLVLLGLPAGAIVTMPLAAALVARFGSRRVAVAGGVVDCLGVALLGLAGSALGLAATLVLFGIGNGAMDIGMNAQGVAVERGYGRPIMSSFHGWFSIGGIGGALFGGLMAQRGVGVGPHLLGIGLAGGAATLIMARWLLPAAADRAGADAERLTIRVPRPVVVLGLVAFCAMLAEGAMADWTAVYLRDIGAGAGLAAAGYAVFSVTMTLGRLAGDRATAALGGAWLVRAGGLLASVGLLLTVGVHRTPAALAGFALVGAGVATVAPIVYSTAGRSRGVAPGTAIAAATTIGYLGFMAGPPLIGLVAGLVALRWALLVVVVLLGAMVALAGVVDRAEALGGDGG